jgi:hypothetical protein
MFRPKLGHLQALLQNILSKKNSAQLRNYTGIYSSCKQCWWHQTISPRLTNIQYRSGSGNIYTYIKNGKTSLYRTFIRIIINYYIYILVNVTNVNDNRLIQWNFSSIRTWTKHIRKELYVFHIGAFNNILYLHDKPTNHVYKYLIIIIIIMLMKG